MNIKGCTLVSPDIASGSSAGCAIRIPVNGRLECLISFVFGGFDKGKGTRSQNMLMRLFQANRPVTPSHFGNAVQCPWFILGSPHGRCFLGWASSGESEKSSCIAIGPRIAAKVSGIFLAPLL